MAERLGLGVIKGLINLNRPKLAVKLYNNSKIHITSITASWVLDPNTVGPVTSFESGLVTIIPQWTDENTIQPDPREVALWRAGAVQPAYLNSLADPIWEARLSGPKLYGHFYFGDRGLVLEAQKQYTVIMSQPSINAAAGQPPNIIDTVGVLSVQGYYEDGEDVFGKLR